MSALLRVTGQGSLGDLLQHPHGRLREPHRPGSFLGQRIVTEDRRVQLAPPAYLERASCLDRVFQRERSRANGLSLITKRDLRTHNSWTHNLEDFVGPKRRTNLLYMHPDDAAARGLADGDLVDVTSDTHTLRLPVALLADLMPGVVALPHGWGHQSARGLSVASKTDGVNVNLLAADGPENVCPLSGMARLTGIPVEVAAAAGAHDPGNWSGVPATERA